MMYSYISLSFTDDLKTITKGLLIHCKNINAETEVVIVENMRDFHCTHSVVSTTRIPVVPFP